MSRETEIRKGTIDDWDKARSEPAAGVYERLLTMAERRRDLLDRAIADLRDLLARRRP